MPRVRRSICTAGVGILLGALLCASAQAGEFNWKRYQGETINFLSSNHPWANAVLKQQNEFTALTGINIRVDTFQEAQMRQRLVTVMQAKSSEVDLYMSLKSREGLQFFNAGWYSILKGQLYTSMPGQSGTVMALGNIFGWVSGFIPLGLGWVAQQYDLRVTMWLLLLGPIALMVGLPRPGLQRDDQAG